MSSHHGTDGCLHSLSCGQAGDGLHSQLSEDFCQTDDPSGFGYFIQLRLQLFTPLGPQLAMHCASSTKSQSRRSKVASPKGSVTFTGLLET